MKPTEEIRFRALREGVFAYRAVVPADGYTWRDDLTPCMGSAPYPPPYLVGPAPPGVQFNATIKPVLHDGLADGLHRTFAGLAGLEQIRTFATRYGSLGQGELNLSEGVGGSVFYGEPLVLWVEEIAAMAALLKQWEVRDTVESARDHVFREVNRRLRGHVNPRVLAHVTTGYNIVFIPDSLIAALYVLLALDLAKGRPQKTCGYNRCGRTFAPRRDNQDYCSDSCRRNASYYRVKERRTP